MTRKQTMRKPETPGCQFVFLFKFITLLWPDKMNQTKTKKVSSFYLFNCNQNWTRGNLWGKAIAWDCVEEPLHGNIGFCINEFVFDSKIEHKYSVYFRPSGWRTMGLQAPWCGLWIWMISPTPVEVVPTHCWPPSVRFWAMMSQALLTQGEMFLSFKKERGDWQGKQQRETERERERKERSPWWRHLKSQGVQVFDHSMQ